MSELIESFGDITCEEDYLPTDWTLAWNENIKISRLYYDTLYLFDQWIDKFTQMACVPLNVYLSICATWWMKPNWNYFNILLKDLKKDWLRNEDEWASLPKVVEWMRKRWNKDFIKLQIATYRDYTHSEIIKEVLRKWYRVPLRYGSRKAYSKDRDDNLSIDKTSYNEIEKWGHCVSLYYSKAIIWNEIIAIHPSKWEKIFERKNPGEWLYIFDSYPFSRWKSNIYTINTLKDLIKNWIFSQWAYTIIKK